MKGPDDYKSMREVVRRRYTRVLNEGLPLPILLSLMVVRTYVWRHRCTRK